MIPPETKESVFDHFVSVAFGQFPTGVTGPRLRMVRPLVLESKEYEDQLLRHRLRDQSIYRLREMNPDTYDHLQSTFWTIVCSEVWPRFPTKEKRR